MVGLKGVLFFLFLTLPVFFFPGRLLAADAPRTAVIQRVLVAQPPPKIQTLKFLKAVTLKPSREIQAAGGKGPGTQQVNLLVGSGIDEALFRRGCALGSWVYEDREPSSGLYYFAPRAFRISWDPQYGYALRFQYNTKEGAGDKTAVLMTATLSGGYNLEDREVLKQLARQSGQIASFRMLKPLPIYDMQVLLDSFTTGFQIPPEQITTIPAKNIGGEIRVTLAMSETQVEEVIASLQDPQGIRGRFSFPLEGGENPIVTDIPIVLSLCDFAVVGVDRWKRGDPFVNRSDFPVRLRKLTVLTKKQDRLASYEYNLGASVLPPHKKVPIQASVIAQDPNALKYIFETDLLCNDCPDCMKSIVAGFRKGIGQARVETLEMTVIPNVFAAFNLFEIVVQVESPYFTPTATTPVGREIKFTAGQNTSTDLPLYLHAVNRAKFSGRGPVLRYRIAVITNEGERFESQDWVESDLVTGNYIGKKQIEAILKPGGGKEGPDRNVLY